MRSNDMAEFVKAGQKLASLKMWKRLGKPNQCGWIVPGWSEMGDDNDFAGVYQGRPRRKTFVVLGEKIPGKRLNFFMKPAWPVNPQTAPQQVQRTKFADGVTEWLNLTTEQKMVYTVRADKKQRQGFCLFMSEYLLSH